jgi:tetratricopeptide (TPR) repeat protein
MNDKKRVVTIILIVIGSVLLLGGVTFWIVNLRFGANSSGQSQNSLEILADLVTIAGLGASIKGWMDLFKKDTPSSTTKIKISGDSAQVATGEHSRNIHTETYTEKPIIDHSENVVIGTQYQNIYQSATPHQVAEGELKAAHAKLDEMPTDQIPEPAVMPQGSHSPNIRPNPLFVGREKELKQLAVWLKGKSAVAIGQVAAATGMGGIGKTQLASEFAHRYGQFFAGGVFWISFSESELIPSEIAACSKFSEDIPLDIRVNKASSEWQSEIPRLLIFDNCDDFDLLAQWLPPTGASRVIVTSHQSSWDLALDIKHLPLGLFERSESIALLLKFRPDLDIDDPNLKAIASELGDLPLAIHMAGSYLQAYRHDITPEQYLIALRKPGLLEHVSLNKGDFSPTGHDLNVGRTFAISIDRLDRKNETDRLATRLLARIACFAPGELIPRGLLKASVGEDIENILFSNGMKRLLGLGLVEENETGDVRMHRLVACFVSNTLQDDEALGNVEQVVSYVASKANASGFPARMQSILPHLQHLTGQALKREDEQAAYFSNSLGYYLESLGDYQSARPYFEQALAIRKKVLGEEHPDTASSLNNLGGLLDSMGDYQGARPFYEQALAIRKKVLGEEHPDTASSLNNLGGLLDSMGDYQGARPYLEQALAIFRKVLGPDHPNTKLVQQNLELLDKRSN